MKVTDGKGNLFTSLDSFSQGGGEVSLSLDTWHVDRLPKVLEYPKYVRPWGDERYKVTLCKFSTNIFSTWSDKFGAFTIKVRIPSGARFEYIGGSSYNYDVETY